MTRASDDLMPTSDEVNRAQREYWADEGPRQYQDYGETNEALFAPFGQAMLDVARLQPSEWVLDVGCGYGTSTIEGAERVAPSGRVVGVDISAAMLEPAHRRVADAGLDNVELLQADAQVHPFNAGSFDAVISRFGMMFFENPEAAFANLARAPARRTAGLRVLAGSAQERMGRDGARRTSHPARAGPGSGSPRRPRPVRVRRR